MRRIFIAFVAFVISVASASAQRVGNINLEARYVTDKVALKVGINERKPCNMKKIVW